jgi:hypothetical protein
MKNGHLFVHFSKTDLQIKKKRGELSNNFSYYRPTE